MDAELKPEAPSVAAYAVWLLRILLPVLLFALWYRSQAPAGPGKYCYPKDLVLAARRPADDACEDAPECLQGLRLVDEATAQRLLGGPPARVGGAGAGGGRRDSRGSRQRPGADRGRQPADGRRPSDDPLLSLVDCPTEEPETPAAAEAAATPRGAAALSPEERRQHEALLAFVAIAGRRGRQQRSFLHDAERPPPPPPRPPVQRLGGAEAPAEEVRRANAEAQTVLRGLLNAKVGLKSADVPKNLYQHLVESQVALDANTFTLLVEGSAGAGDLQTASDFLMKMEAAGHCASSELLDLVMDLYADGGSRPAGATSAEAIDGRE